jgi:hypothetical protein
VISWRSLHSIKRFLQSHHVGQIAGFLARGFNPFLFERVLGGTFVLIKHSEHAGAVLSSRASFEFKPLFEINGITKKYKGVGPRMATLKAEMKVLRNEWSKKVRAKAAARS